MEISQGVRDRIFLAADSIYAEIDRKSFPPVDAVRKRAWQLQFRVSCPRSSKHAALPR
jgi:hypothetical protein